MDEPRTRVQQLARDYRERGDPTGWFEPLYAGAARDLTAIPWARGAANPNLAGWLAGQPPPAPGERALVVGCGLGDDAEALAARGYTVTAFDIAPSAIAWARERFPGSAVQYHVADVLALPAAWRGQFDFIVEAYTLQVLPAALRPAAMAGIAGCLRPGGRLLLICRAREPEEAEGSLPWPLTRAEVEHSERLGLECISFEDYRDPVEPFLRRFRALYRA